MCEIARRVVPPYEITIVIVINNRLSILLYVQIDLWSLNFMQSIVLAVIFFITHSFVLY